LKEDVAQAIEAGKLKRSGVSSQQEAVLNSQEFPPINEHSKPHQLQHNQQQYPWNHTPIDTHTNNESNTAKMLGVISESLVAMRESSTRVEDKLEKMIRQGNQNALDVELHQDTIEKLIENVQLLIEHVLWPIAGQIKPELLESAKGLQATLNRLSSLKTSLRDDYKARRKRAETPPIQEQSATSKNTNSSIQPTAVRT